jgi:predicted nucleic acid-binding protein
MTPTGVSDSGKFEELAQADFNYDHGATLPDPNDEMVLETASNGHTAAIVTFHD